MKEKISDIYQKIQHILNPKSEWDEKFLEYVRPLIGALPKYIKLK